MKWSLYNKEGKFLEPLKFSNGKTQEDVVNEVLDSIKKGNKIVFIRGVCGTGKSTIALNIARNLGKTSIVVPGKNLQMQYKKDYEGDKYLEKNSASGGKLKISVITGRNNHKCKLLEDDRTIIPKIKREIDSKLEDIFEFSKEERENKNKEKTSADRNDLPCKIELKEKNFKKIKEYLKKNKDINPSNFLSIRDVKRASVANACPYWCPVLPERYELKGKSFEEVKKITYKGLNGENFSIYPKKEGCSFYEQFKSYIESDVLVFNSLKYKLESALNRKPLTEIEIIDECDEFLDSFSNQSTINIERLHFSMGNIFSKDDSTEKIVNDLNVLIKEIKNDPAIGDAIYSNAIIPLKGTAVHGLFKTILNGQEIFEYIDDESYLFEVEETARMFEDFIDDSYLMFSKKDNALLVNIVTTNLAKKFKEMVDKNKIVVLMSGTLHSDEVLKKVFGLENYKIIEAEVEQQGQIEVVKTGLEKDCKYDNFSSGKHSRENYLKALDKCVEIAKKPILVHVNSFNDLPSKKEIEEFKLKNVIQKELLKEEQDEDNQGNLVKEFKDGKRDILFSTRASRGVDFPGEQCNSIIFTKYPNPNVQDAFWKILAKTKPQYYWEFYRDKAKRELLQKVYRGLRSKKDHVYVLSPDSRVLDVFEKI